MNTVGSTSTFFATTGFSTTGGPQSMVHGPSAEPGPSPEPLPEPEPSPLPLPFAGSATSGDGSGFTGFSGGTTRSLVIGGFLCWNGVAFFGAGLPSGAGGG